jgi:hypothetical protein
MMCVWDDAAPAAGLVGVFKRFLSAWDSTHRQNVMNVWRDNDDWDVCVWPEWRH